MISNKERPLISIVVPIYKVENYLDRCICSITEQSYRNLEILLIDDGSPDRCGEICDEWSRKDLRIKVIHKANGGLSDARNSGIERAQGEYIAFIDSDDYIEHEMIEKLYEAATRANVPIAACNYIYEFDANMDKHSKADPQVYQIQQECLASCYALLKLMAEGKYTFGVVAWNKLYKKDLFESIRYPVGKIHEDEFVFHRLIYQSKNIVCIPYVGYHYLQRSNSIMDSQKNYKDVFEAALDRCLFFMEKQERELTIESEKRLIGTAKNAKSKGRVKKSDLLIKQYTLIVWELFLKRWIPMKTFCKRIVRLYIL